MERQPACVAGVRVRQPDSRAKGEAVVGGKVVGEGWGGGALGIPGEGG